MDGKVKIHKKYLGEKNEKIGNGIFSGSCSGDGWLLKGKSDVPTCGDQHREFAG
jgi:hypothetical protein